MGLDIGSSNIKAVHLSRGKRGYRLEEIGVVRLDPELIVDGTIVDADTVTDSIRELIRELGIKTREVALSVSGHAVIVKKIQVPRMTESELEESFRWEADPFIPFDINDVNIDFHILSPENTPDDTEQMTVALVAVKKDKISEYTSIVTEAGLIPVVMDTDSFTLENMFCTNYRPVRDEVVALVDIGASVMNIHIVRGGEFSFTRDVSMGGNRYTEAIQKEMNLGYDEAEKVKKGEQVSGVDSDLAKKVIETIHAETALEISRTFDYFRNISTHHEVDRMLMSGGCAKTPGMTGYLSEEFGFPTELVNPFQQIEVDPYVFDIQYIEDIAPLAAIGVGLATRQIGDR